MGLLDEIRNEIIEIKIPADNSVSGAGLSNPTLSTRKVPMIVRARAAKEQALAQKIAVVDIEAVRPNPRADMLSASFMELSIVSSNTGMSRLLTALRPELLPLKARALFTR